MLKPILLQISMAGDSLSVANAEMAPHEETISVLELIANGGWYIMVPLGILSVLAVYIFIERFLAIQNASKEDPNFMNQIKDFIHEGKIDSAKKFAVKNKINFFCYLCIF